MRLTKKAAALLVAATMIASMGATPVFADGASNTSTNKGTTAPTATNVKYKVNESYTWSIPAKIDFGEDAGVTSADQGKTRTVNASATASTASTASTDSAAGTAPAIYVTENIIGVGKTLKISISTSQSYDTNSGFYVQNGTDSNVQKLYYTVKKGTVSEGSVTATGDALNNSDKAEVLTVAAGTNTASQALVFELNTKNGGTAEKAGDYTGTLSFTAVAE